MKNIQVGGVFDGVRVLLDEPLSVPPNTRVVVSCVEQTKAAESMAMVDELIGVAKSRLGNDVDLKELQQAHPWIGSLKYSGPPRTLEDMEDGVRQGALEVMKWCQ